LLKRRWSPDRHVFVPVAIVQLQNVVVSMP
jgi:hypothetical protein